MSRWTKSVSVVRSTNPDNLKCCSRLLLLARATEGIGTVRTDSEDKQMVTLPLGRASFLHSHWYTRAICLQGNSSACTLPSYLRSDPLPTTQLTPDNLQLVCSDWDLSIV